MKNKKLIMIFVIIIIVVSARICVSAETYEYDKLNRLVKVVHDDGSYTEYKYDKNGNLISVKVYNKETTKKEQETTKKESETTKKNQETTKKESETTKKYEDKKQQNNAENRIEQVIEKTKRTQARNDNVLNQPFNSVLSIIKQYDENNENNKSKNSVNGETDSKVVKNTGNDTTLNKTYRDSKTNNTNRFSVNNNATSTPYMTARKLFEKISDNVNSRAMKMNEYIYKIIMFIKLMRVS
ncbi:yD repeat protein [Eubacterium sp. CAG:603]|nr:yD repeat protein [Eubacterium sp. CAG:603]